jgi:hypothetical protein
VREHQPPNIGKQLGLSPTVFWLIPVGDGSLIVETDHVRRGSAVLTDGVRVDRIGMVTRCCCKNYGCEHIVNLLGIGLIHSLVGASSEIRHSVTKTEQALGSCSLLYTCGLDDADGQEGR